MNSKLERRFNRYDAKKQRLVQDWRYSYFYDNNGNLTSKQAKGLTGEVTNFSYSTQNQLLGFKVYQASNFDPSTRYLPPPSTLVKEVQYVYDAFGRRISKQVTDLQAPSDPKRSFGRAYVYDGQDVALEYDLSNTLLARYTYSGLGADSILEAEVTAAGADSTHLLAQNAGRYYYLKDVMGSIVDIADNQGNKLQHYVYSAFGELLSLQDGSGNDISGNPVLATTYTFTGRELDSESGFYYFRARYYDSVIGRFLQADPSPGTLSLPASVINGYIYGANNPYSYSDPSGASFWTDFGRVLLGIVEGIAAAVVAAVVVVASVFTGGAAGIISGIVLGAVVGTATGAVVGAIGGGLLALAQGGDFGQGAAQGMVSGALTGFIAGATAGLMAGLSAVSATGALASTTEEGFTTLGGNIADSEGVAVDSGGTMGSAPLPAPSGTPPSSISGCWDFIMSQPSPWTMKGVDFYNCYTGVWDRSVWVTPAPAP